MSRQTIEGFRERINSDSALMERAKAAFYKGLPAVVALGAEYGYSFTEVEAEEAVAEYSQDGELSDFELELVSAGSATPSSDLTITSAFPG